MRRRALRGQTRGRGGAALAAATGVALVALGVPCGSGCERGPEDPNLLLLVADAMRADALSCYGGPASTPHICSLAERGVLFERAYSASSWTLPSSVAMFTGNHPTEYSRDPSDLEEGEPYFFVRDEERLLAEALRERGYEVRSYVENRVAAQGNTLQGFAQQPLDVELDPSEVDALERRHGIDASDPRERRLLPILRELAGDLRRPFFLLQWFLDPHAVYDPPPALLNELPAETGTLPRPLAFYTRLGSKHRPEADILPLKSVGPRLSPRERSVVKALYLKEVESVDARVGILLDALDAAGRRDDTLVLFLSDHGEGFGEHGRFLHGNSFFEETVRVPFLVAGPGVARGLRVEEPVAHVDLVPTLRELFDVSGLRDDLRGRSLVPWLRGARDASDERALYLAKNEQQDAIVRGAHKLIASGDTRFRLYDLSDDPRERRSLEATRRDVADRLRSELRGLRSQNRARRERHQRPDDADRLRRIEEETLRELRAIGYVE